VVVVLVVGIGRSIVCLVLTGQQRLVEEAASEGWQCAATGAEQHIITATMVSLQIGDLTVVFPYSRAYPEQLQYMEALRNVLREKGHAVLEMPTGTGKTAALLALILSFRAQHSRPSKVIYCTRTVAEVDKVLQELKQLQAVAHYPLLALSLSSRKNLCIFPEVSQLVGRVEVDSACWSHTAPWNTASRCPLYSGFQARSASWKIPPGVYSLADIKSLCEEANLCPYFTVRHYLSQADVLVCSYQYLLDPRIAAAVTHDLPSDSVLIFDEAHNIDNVCIEAMSLNITRKSLHSSLKSVDSLRRLVKEARDTDARRLQEEYQRLMLRIKPEECPSTAGGELVQLPAAYIDELLPGSIRKAEHFLYFLLRILGALKTSLKTKDARIYSPYGFAYFLKTEGQVDQLELKYASDRLRSLLLALKVESLAEHFALQVVCELCAQLSTRQQGFTVIIEPYPETSKFDPVLQFTCLDASLGVKDVFQRFDSVILTSGTISPIGFYQKILSFTPTCVLSIDMTIDRPCICPIILTKGSDQLAVSSKFEERDDDSIIRNYGELLTHLADTIPDGIVCFFTSYKHMEGLVTAWSDKGIIHQILEKKLVYFESRNREETNAALHHFRLACDCGRGAIFMSIARGKVAEGIDFSDHYGRCIVLFGVPFQNTLSRVLKSRLGYLKDRYGLDERDFLSFDAMRQVAQCCGRAIRSKEDYAVLMLADKRYLSADKKEKLPKWIKQHFAPASTNLSTDIAVQVAADFLRRTSKRSNS